MKATPTQMDVLRRLVAADACLVRWAGGFWTFDGCPARVYQADVVAPRARPQPPTPEWWTSIQTVRAMERRGLLVRLGREVSEWRDARQLTDAGRAAAAGEGGNPCAK